jgi:putative CocE/NonD family hydrolase
MIHPPVKHLISSLISPLIISFIMFIGNAACAQDEFIVKRDLIIAMSDGVELSTDIYLPSENESFPTILIRTPYGKNQKEIFASFFAKNGYAVAVQDVRGKWSSTGDMIPFINEQQDGLETLAWLESQHWCNGNIGMWGASYLSYCALVVAASTPASLKTVFSISGWLNGEKINNPGGALHWMLILQWMLHEATQKYRTLTDYDIDELLNFTPLQNAMLSVGIEDPVFSNPDTLELARYDYAAVQIPVFHITGWYDFVYPAALTVYDEVSKHSSHFQKLMIGPWVHDQVWTTYTEGGDEDFGEQAAMGIDKLNRLAVRWFDRWLKGIDNGITGEPPVEAFHMGRNEWAQYDDWPPQGVTFAKWYLTSRGTANTLNGSGILTGSAPGNDFPNDTFVFDPMNPVPTIGGANFHFFPDVLGVKDQRVIEERSDVLVYTSEALASDLDICGPVRVLIYAATEAKDTDFTAKLVEVRKDGYARNIVEGIVRASYRNSLEESELLEPGRIYRLSIDLGATAIRIPEGHRIRLEISSSNFPKYDRNPNTGEMSWEAVRYETASQTIYHDAQHPSHIVLPVFENASGK